MYVSGYETSPFGVEWMRFEPDSQPPDIVKTVPHVAFEVDDLERELEGRKVIVEPNSPSPLASATEQRAQQLQPQIGRIRVGGKRLFSPLCVAVAAPDARK